MNSTAHTVLPASTFSVANAGLSKDEGSRNTESAQIADAFARMIRTVFMSELSTPLETRLTWAQDHPFVMQSSTIRSDRRNSW